MANHQIHIPEKLKQYVSRVWVAEEGDEQSFPIFADGSTGIIFQQSDTASGMVLGGSGKVLSSTFAFGQTVDPIVLKTNKNCRVLGILLHPHVLQSIFGFSSKELTDECIDLQLLPAVPRINLNEQLWNTVTVERQAEILFKYLDILISKNNREPDKSLQYATTRLMEAPGNTSLKQIQQELHVTERTFERKFEQHVGVSPRLFSSIAQFQAAFKQLKKGTFSKLSDIAYENGYADQSHFIRFFKKFTGISPLQFCRQVRGNDYIEAHLIA
jgi:AraC-like DNA-binding protein